MLTGRKAIYDFTSRMGSAIKVTDLAGGGSAQPMLGGGRTGRIVGAGRPFGWAIAITFDGAELSMSGAPGPQSCDHTAALQGSSSNSQSRGDTSVATDRRIHGIGRILIIEN